MGYMHKVNKVNEQLEAMSVPQNISAENYQTGLIKFGIAHLH
jgi:hypothetical protein